MSTPLHAALGRVEDALSFELVEEACSLAVPETEELDFKRDLPLPVSPVSERHELELRLELAKDLAAMANGRGGMLVYGVRDEHDAAAELVGVPDTSDGVMEKQIRQVAYNFVHPPLRVECTQLSGGGKHVLVLQIAESEDAPHLVRPKRTGGNEGWLIAPYRSGPETDNMVEKQLESAYRQRFEGRRSRQQSLRDMHAELGVRHIDPDEQAVGTVLALARPARATSPAPDRVATARRAEAILGRARYWTEELRVHLMKGEASVPLQSFSEHRPLRRGLYRYVLATPPLVRSVGKLDGLEAYVAIELHDDGSIGLVWRRGQRAVEAASTTALVPEPALGATDMDAVTLMLVTLMNATHEEIGLRGGYHVRVSIAPQATLHLIHETQQPGASPFERVEAPPVVESEVRLGDGPSVRADDLLGLGQDLANILGREETVLDRFWNFNGSNPDHPRRMAANWLLGGLPPHPLTGHPL